MRLGGVRRIRNCHTDPDSVGYCADALDPQMTEMMFSSATAGQPSVLHSSPSQSVITFKTICEVDELLC